MKTDLEKTIAHNEVETINENSTLSSPTEVCSAEFAQGCISTTEE